MDATTTAVKKRFDELTGLIEAKTKELNDLNKEATAAKSYLQAMGLVPADQKRARKTKDEPKSEAKK